MYPTPHAASLSGQLFLPFDRVEQESNLITIERALVSRSHPVRKHTKDILLVKARSYEKKDSKNKNNDNLFPCF